MPTHGVTRLCPTLPDDLAARLATPALVIRVDRARANVRRVLARLDDDADRWRCHLKTTKSPALWRLLLDAGLRAFKCATVREAEVFAAAFGDGAFGDLDLLVAYPHAGPNLDALARLARRHPRVRLSVLVEDEDGAAAAPPELGLFVDLDVGMQRTGRAATDRAGVCAAAHAAGARFRGLHAYEGHLGALAGAARRAEAERGYAEVAALVADLRAQGRGVAEVVTSGTPGLACAAAAPTLRALRASGVRHRVSPGTVVLADQRTLDDCAELGLEPAAFVAARVASRPGAHRITLDAGAKAIAAEVGDPCVRVVGHPDWIARTPSEEHLPVDLPDGAPRPRRGTLLLLVPRHVCPTVNLAEAMVLLDGDRLLGAAPVAARAHALRFRA